MEMIRGADSHENVQKTYQRTHRVHYCHCRETVFCKPESGSAIALLGGCNFALPEWEVEGLGDYRSAVQSEIEASPIPLSRHAERNYRAV